ncbi:hypothetical protein NUITMVS1_45420 (plasmid) [Shewanella xiamenensis]|nr:hypothetical protein NUITMVS1_45420 [Shewanella xiamenensis]
MLEKLFNAKYSILLTVLSILAGYFLVRFRSEFDGLAFPIQFFLIVAELTLGLLLVVLHMKTTRTN